MDAPQWYNSRLWNTSRQNIDGKPIRPSTRPQSASTSFNRPGFNIQPMTGNWSTFMRGHNSPFTNRDQGFTFRYSNPYRQTKSPSNKLSTTFPSRYYNSMSPSFNYPSRNTDRINSAQSSSNKTKQIVSNGDPITLQGEPKPITSSCPTKIILKPNLMDYEHRIWSSSVKQDVVHGNINTNQTPTDEQEDLSDVDLSQSLSENVVLSPSSILAPQNTPRITGDLSSLIRQPTKSILKKSAVDSEQPKIPTFTIYNNFYPSRVRTISASSKSLLSSQAGSFSDFRRSLQSAPGSKREVRFDMTSNNVIEYSPND